MSLEVYDHYAERPIEERRRSGLLDTLRGFIELFSEHPAEPLHPSSELHSPAAVSGAGDGEVSRSCLANVLASSTIALTGLVVVAVYAAGTGRRYLASALNDDKETGGV